MTSTILSEHDDPESIRLIRDPIERTNWKLWGPYLSERQWGTVREDYSANAEPWESFPREQAPYRAYRWGEDGLMGWSDRYCRLCFSVSLWNGKDRELKERLFGLTNHEGNHGEDVKEMYYYVDSTPTHSYARSLYKYPQSAFPYETLLSVNQSRSRDESEFEIEETGAFDEDRFFDVETEYAKGSPEDILIRIRISNRGPDPAPLSVLPTLWFRNTWSWGGSGEDMTSRPEIYLTEDGCLRTTHDTLASYQLVFEGQDEVWFTDNETNPAIWNKSVNPVSEGYYKDAFHQALIEGKKEALRTTNSGTKSAILYQATIQPGETKEIRLRLTKTGSESVDSASLGDPFQRIFQKRHEEANEFYRTRMPEEADAEDANIMRQAYAGLLWTKQFYHYVVNQWLDGDPDNPAPPPRRDGRNSDWNHLFNRDVISMPDKWEYPWYAAWDLAFHMLPFAELDPHFAKWQLQLFLREWYMHPNGQLPAYEWNFSDTNPPVHAWAVWRVYKIAESRGDRDLSFLSSAFQKLLMNFTWWVNREDPSGHNIFSGGFLGLDNIGVFDRSHGLPVGARLEQSDATAWMAFYCTTMLAIALELADHDRAYEDLASKFFEHFVSIALAMNGHGRYSGLWCDEGNFYYDWLVKDGRRRPMEVRSIVGLLPLIANEMLEQSVLEKLEGFRKRTNWFLTYRPHLAEMVSSLDNDGNRRLLSVCPPERFAALLTYLFDESEFLSPYGIRSLSRYHEKHPFEVQMERGAQSVSYVPGESNSPMFGGNSNWRGPIWFPVNYLLVEALERYHHFYGDSYLVEFPTGSGNRITLLQAADEIGNRLINLFRKDPQTGRRPSHGDLPFHSHAGAERELLLFYEYFHADTGRGLGASHQTGWTSLVARLIRKRHT